MKHLTLEVELLPNEDQRAQLQKILNYCVEVHNKSLAAMIKSYHSHNHNLNLEDEEEDHICVSSDLVKILRAPTVKQLRDESPHLEEVSYTPLFCAVRAQQKQFIQFIESKGTLPKFLEEGDINRFKEWESKFYPSLNMIKMPKLEPIKFSYAGEIPEECLQEDIKSIIVLKEKDRWRASLMFEGLLDNCQQKETPEILGVILQPNKIWKEMGFIELKEVFANPEIAKLFLKALADWHQDQFLKKQEEKE